MATPTGFAVNTSHYSDEGYVHISWVGTPSANHYSYRVYRLDPDGSETVVRERSDTAANYTYDDYSAPVGTVRYAVVEVTAIGDVQTEEAKAYKAVTLESPYYWLVHPTDSNYTQQLRGVNSEEFGTEREVEVKKLIGRGRKIDVGDNYGRNGTISGRIYGTPTKSARQIRLDLEAAKDTNSYFYLRNPFGDSWKIWWDDPRFNRIAGVGLNEYVEISFGYYEVA